MLELGPTEPPLQVGLLDVLLRLHPALEEEGGADHHRLRALGLKTYTQEELRELLADRGFDVTQATLSRDLRSLGYIQ